MRNLKNSADSKIFYDERYRMGYMQEWPADKKDRIQQIISEMNLPSSGDALDFGCGNGVFTTILKHALPMWHVYGCDISEVAIKNAADRDPECIFFVNDSAAHLDQKFAFIFTHHVLEHVFDIKEVARQIVDRASANSAMLHICPCGNDGSFERELCGMRVGGINREREDRFFYEDEGHVRRLTSNACALLFREYGFQMESEYYSNQYYGAVNWISRSPLPLILIMFNPIHGKTTKVKLRLTYLLLKFVTLTTLRLFHRYYNKYRDRILVRTLFFAPAYLLAELDRYLINRSDLEWNECKRQPNGSEMYLFFARRM